MLKTLAFRHLSKSINKLLATDPSCFAELKQLSGHSIAIHVSSIPFTFYLDFTPDGLYLNQEKKQADIELTGTASALLKLAKSDEPISMLSSKEVHLRGEVELLLKLKHIRQQLDLDVEALVAEYTGDLMANRLGIVARATGQFARRQANRLRDQFKEYLQEELQVLPSKLEFQDLKQDISQFRHQLERVEARLSHHLTGKKHA